MSAAATDLEVALDTAQRIARRLEASLADHGFGGDSITPDGIAGLDETALMKIDALLKRFEQMQDYVSRQLFRQLLLALGERIAGLSARDAFDRLEGLGAIASAEAWMDFAATRHRVTHDYPTMPSKQAERINKALQEGRRMLASFRQVETFILQRGLLEEKAP